MIPRRLFRDLVAAAKAKLSGIKVVAATKAKLSEIKELYRSSNFFNDPTFEPWVLPHSTRYGFRSLRPYLWDKYCFGFIFGLVAVLTLIDASYREDFADGNEYLQELRRENHPGAQTKKEPKILNTTLF